MYLPIVRDQLSESLMIFDFPDPSLIIGERSTTTIPSQALYLMNNSFVIQQAEAMAKQLTSEINDEVERLKRAYKLCFSRQPSETEINLGLKFLEDYGKKHSQRSTWATLCQAMFASAEFAQR